MVAMLKHLPEVDGEAVDVFWFAEADLVVMGCVTVFHIGHTLIVDFPRDRLVVNFARIGPSVLHEAPPFVHPFRAN